MTTLSDRLTKAAEFARAKHDGQLRKGTRIPYYAHLLAVTSLLLEHGGTEDQAIAALLHDTVEDCGGLPVLEEVRANFGNRIAAMVSALSDAAPLPGEAKPPWRVRKQAYLDHLPRLSPEVQLISACDKLHNARSILSDLRSEGVAVFDRFKGGMDGTLWYYRSLADLFVATGLRSVACELDEVVSAIESGCRAG